MGSLVPGWDADIGVPRELADTDMDKDPQPRGYFARLSSHRQSHEGASLERISAPQSLVRSVSKQPAPVQRASTLSHGGAPATGANTKYQFTDWSEELASLRKGGLGRTSLGAHEGRHEQGQDGAAWWRALEVGHLNEHPDAAHNFTHDTQRSTFVPQFTQSQKLDFGEAEK